ncbi:sigma 54-interacting transcriptional regulator [Candidatus Phycosocius spiralis]|uniref:DNA-binding transcriptional regulator NtrC n=1 Tax=Candidatus Phycosocius spiralis TaxID=2815099 RepID=A0ABQ4PSJ9_9PROT|nr:sigma 54-interacting transcriptional regulator [Candidatus Phycosocius spiralis]GIU65971.1 nitrogen regulation protein NR(I) [Candidatus Phycosocius spiralis]
MSVTGRNVLIADDDASIRLVLSQALARESYQVRATGNAATLWKWIKEGEGDLVLTDVMMSDGNVFDYLPRMRMERPKLPIIVMSAQNTLLTAVSAAEHGAYEYLPKPFDLDVMIGLVRRALDGKKDFNASNQQRKAEKEERLPLIGRSLPMQEVYRTLSRAAGFDLTILIEGESGVGKKLVARVVHDYGRRKTGPFVTLSLAALDPRSLDQAIEGHGGKGIFAQASGGTLFLDGLADAPLPTQARLAHILSDRDRGKFQADNVRLIAASDRNLKDLVIKGSFREDLYYCLNVITIFVPPLRERMSDVADLARAFLARATKQGLGEKVLDKTGVQELETWSWPGNVRELENVMHKIAALSPDPVISADTIRRELFRERSLTHGSGVGSHDDDLEAVARKAIAKLIAQASALGRSMTDLHDSVIAAVERPLFELTLRETRGNQIKAAEILGLNRNTLRKRLAQLAVDVGKGKL